MVRARELRWFAATAGLVTATLLVVPGWSPLHADAQRSSAAVERVVDDVEEHDIRQDIDHVPAVTDAGVSVVVASAVAAPQVVAVRTPPTAMILMDAHGEVEAAWTNTGLPPQHGDELWLMHLDGSITAAASPSIVDRPWRGDFSRAGVFVDQGSGSDTTAGG